MPDDTLERLLEQMHAALMLADFTALAALLPAFDAVVPPDPAQLGRLRHLAARNAACLQAARRGIKAARARWDELAKSADGLATYDPRGQRSGTGAPGRFARRF